MPMNPRLLRPLASSGFNPMSISGLEAWWDAADSASVTLDAGRVSALADKSGNGRHAENGTSGSTQPDYITGAVNGRNVARFTAASTQRLEVASSTAAFNFLHNGTPSFIAAVASFGTSADPNAAHGLLGNMAGSFGFRGCCLFFDDRASLSRNESVAAFVSAGGSVNNVNAVAANIITPAAAAIITLALDPANSTASDRSEIAVNGGEGSRTNAATGAVNTGNSGFNMQIGTTGNQVLPLTGDVCEILMYSQIPTLSQQSYIRQYLAKKWGITLA